MGVGGAGAGVGGRDVGVEGLVGGYGVRCWCFLVMCRQSTGLPLGEGNMVQ